jgi:hypothetical protein
MIELDLDFHSKNECKERGGKTAAAESEGRRQDLS